MFKRRKPHRTHHKLINFLWPKSGLKRSWTYIAHRIGRLPDSPSSIAIGFACGAAISFTPFIGFHFILSALLTWALGANILASAIGTIIGNPWTFPIIWTITYKLGHFILGFNGYSEVPEPLTFGYLWESPWVVLLPMTIGAIPTGGLTWIVSFFSVKKAVEKYKFIRQSKRFKFKFKYKKDQSKKE